MIAAKQTVINEVHVVVFSIRCHFSEIILKKRQQHKPHLFCWLNYRVIRKLDFNRAEPKYYRTNFPLHQIGLTKWSFFVHSTTSNALYVHPRLDSIFHLCWALESAIAVETFKCINISTSTCNKGLVNLNTYSNPFMYENTLQIPKDRTISNWKPPWPWCDTTSQMNWEKFQLSKPLRGLSAYGLSKVPLCCMPQFTYVLLIC